MTPRLKQPLYADLILKEAPRDLVLAYDTIWNLTNNPEDIKPEAMAGNVRVVLERLGSVIEAFCGPDVFEYDPRQLTFCENILNPKPAPEAQKEP